MIKILKEPAEFVRGDTFIMGLPIKYDDGKVVELDDIKTLIFTCRKTYEKTSKVLITKNKEDFEFDDDVYWITIKPEDTEQLPYGDYQFDIEATLKDGYRQTFKSSLKLTGECTMHGDDNG